MSYDPVDQMIVRHIIGDIRVAFDPDDVEFDDIEPVSDEEVAEIDAYYEANKHLFPDPTPEETERFIAHGMKIFRFTVYKLEAKKRGLPHLDLYEFMNMAVEPTVPEDDAP